MLVYQTLASLVGIVWTHEQGNVVFLDQYSLAYFEAVHFTDVNRYILGAAASSFRM